MFACVYYVLLNGTIFYLPNKRVRNTAEVEMDYIVYQKLENISPHGITYNGILKISPSLFCEQNPEERAFL